MGRLPFGVQAFECLTDAVIIVDKKLIVLFVNKAATDLYNISKDACIGQPLTDVFLQESINSDNQNLDSILKHIKSWSGKTYHVTKGGHRFLVDLSISPFYDSLDKNAEKIIVIRPIKLNDASAFASQNTDYDVNRQELTNIVDSKALQSMMDDLYSVTKIGCAVLDLKGNVLASAGWQDICSKFHRINPQSLWNCLESDLQLTRGVAAGEFRAYKCKNNMWDIVTPLIIGKKHVGNVFSGQFFFDNENIDREFFAKQAEKFGFDKESYLSALDRVPIWNRKTIESLMQFYVKLAEMISKLSYSNLKLSKTLLEQKSTENRLIKIQHDLNHAQDVARTGSWRLNVQKNELVWSEETYKLFGIQKSTLLTYETFLKHIHPDDREYVDESWRAAMQGKKYDVEHRIIVNNNVFWVRERAELEFDHHGTLIAGFGTVQDITEHKMNEQKLRKLNRAMRAISNSNQALMRASDEAAFLQQGCRIIVEDCGYALVWVGFAQDDSEKSLKPVTYAGLDGGYIDSLKITWADTERGCGRTSKAIRTGKAQICRDINTEGALEPSRKEALKRGFISFIALPLLSQGKAFGVINIYSKEKNLFSKDEVELLTELSNDFAHGIMLLRMKLAKEKAEKELLNTSEKCRIALEASNLGSWDYNIGTGEVYWDERTRDMFGVTSGQTIKYEEAISRIHPEDRFATDEAVKEAIAGVNDGKYDYSFRVIWPDGSIHWVASHGKVFFSGDGKEKKAIRFVGVNMDISRRKADEEALNKSRAEWERTFDSLPDLIAVIDSKHRIIRVNKAMADRLGVKPEHCFGQECFVCVHGTKQNPSSCPHAETLKDGKLHVVEIHDERLGGDFLVSTSPLTDENGKVFASIHIAREIKKEN